MPGHHWPACFRAGSFLVVYPAALLRSRWALSIEYERHEPEKTLLHEVVREQLESFLARSSRDGAPVARFVEREIRAYLECGVLAHGFLRVHCDGCGHAAEVLEGAHMGGDEVRRPLALGGFGAGVVRGAEHGDEEFALADFATSGIHDLGFLA